MITGGEFHDLRKLCKQVRYQSEFFLPLYPKSLKRWIKEVKSIQSGLGQIQDAHVLREFLQQYQPDWLTRTAQEELLWRDGAIAKDWDNLQQQYTDPAYRHQIHQLILSPSGFRLPDTARPPSDR